ncbi:copper homeostasis membrane protein CopD [Novosphingobium sp.]|uniref:copper homeostasis membrane protein CopD n=1 Tax=Novosphingobium sp. TaxID=1874826 RepID=UPI002621C0C4|nr:copper homeostasis membrane protein CopD [Novosphingobium sp.]
MPLVELTRWALYLDLGVLFGVPTAAVLLGMPGVLKELRLAMLVIAMAAAPLALLGFWVLVADMAGTSLGEVDSGLILDLAKGSTLGWAFIGRLVFLVAALIVVALPAVDRRWLVLPAGAALASLAWSGHAASGEGMTGTFRLVVDMVHLAAASVWFGALALFAVLLATGRHRAVLPAVLARFADIGTLLVVVLVATGLANLLFVKPQTQWFALAATPYGRMLVIKLGLFGAMLVLAAINRFFLVPELPAPADKDIWPRLTLTISAEFGCATALLASVAWLGHLDPLVS